MVFISPLLNLVSRSIRKIGKRVVRDFNEIEKLQTSVKGTSFFANQSLEKLKKNLLFELNIIKPEVANILLNDKISEVKKNEKDCWIIKPLDGINYTLGFWINIKDFYQDHTYWRHVLHKGTAISRCQVLDYNYWENILIDINQQSPGVWLHPDKNTLRLCFTTEINKEYNAPKDAHTFSGLPILEHKTENIHLNI